MHYLSVESYVAAPEFLLEFSDFLMGKLAAFVENEAHASLTYRNVKQALVSILVQVLNVYDLIDHNDWSHFLQLAYVVLTELARFLTLIQTGSHFVLHSAHIQLLVQPDWGLEL